ncbi:hypothetical protein DB41_KO00100 [Neochlamydia sp. TUME1]|uniref:F-box/WD repeat-containing protein n=1 Tax=Neochlamydia sp. TUME1 TaxID=1478174 RepID=UPI00057EDD45|nr:F-box/WD40 repeat-containing protein [Neochlamydia sp. TUME1]KIC72322.1 hypothetical protein DB41_KO00100 [Neochlamydia sp. TUME1]
MINNISPAFSPSTVEISQNIDSWAISKMPDEVWIKIFSYLPAKDLAFSRQVSRQWSQLASDPLLWHPLVLKKFPFLPPLSHGKYTHSMYGNQAAYHVNVECKRFVKFIEFEDVEGSGKAVFSPDSQWIVSSAKDNTAHVWNAFNGKRHQILEGHTGLITSITFSEDGNWLATTSADCTARLWKLESNKWICKSSLKGHLKEVCSAAFFHRLQDEYGWLVATGSLDCDIRLWDMNTGKYLTTFRGKVRAPVKKIGFLPNGDNSMVVIEPGVNRAYFWAMGPTSSATVKREDASCGHDSSFKFIGPFALSPDKKAGAFLLKLGKLGICELDALKENQRILTIPPKPILCLAYSPDGESLAISFAEEPSQKPGFDVYHLPTGKVYKYEAEEIGESLNKITYSPDGQWIVSGNSEWCALWQVNRKRIWWKGQEKTPLYFISLPCNDNLSFSPNGRQLLIGNTVIDFFDIEGKLIADGAAEEIKEEKKQATPEILMEEIIPLESKKRKSRIDKSQKEEKEIPYPADSSPPSSLKRRKKEE